MPTVTGTATATLAFAGGDAATGLVTVGASAAGPITLRAAVGIPPIAVAFAYLLSSNYIANQL